MGMKLITLTPLESHVRSNALSQLVRGHPQAVVLEYDALEGNELLRRVTGDQGIVERAERVLERWCLGCVYRFEIVPTILRLASRSEDSVMILALPPTWAAQSVSDFAAKSLFSAGISVDSSVSALEPESLEEQLWDKHTLWESGYSVNEEDQTVPGEFMIHEIAWADTLVLARGISAELRNEMRSEVVEEDESQGRGLKLVAELAAHAVINAIGHSVVLGEFDSERSIARVVPGNVPPGVEEAGETIEGHYATHLLRAERPLHPESFKEALPELAASCASIRGTLWVASAPGMRIALGGAGARVWLQSTGVWGMETACTRIALTSDEHEYGQISEILHRCELSVDELARMSVQPQGGSSVDAYGIVFTDNGGEG